MALKYIKIVTVALSASSFIYKRQPEHFRLLPKRDYNLLRTEILIMYGLLKVTWHL